MPLCSGATVVTMPRFEPGRFLELLQAHRVTVLVWAPPMLRVPTGHPLAAAADLGALELAARLPGATVGRAYGLTETTVGASMPDRDTGSVPGTVGRIMPNTELRVADPETGRDLGAGQIPRLLQPAQLAVRHSA